jgi:ABC-type transport system involved in multi-copper enzyme maturation permease subunit
MIWVSWRRQRAQLITLLGMLVIGAGAITLLRSTMIDAIDSSQLTQCVTQALQECSAPGEVAKAFREAWSTPFIMGQAAIIGLPALIGVFIGAPLFARELEQGTHVLAFTQSVSRTRWMFSKLVVALVPALIVLIALQSLV